MKKIFVVITLAVMVSLAAPQIQAQKKQQQRKHQQQTQQPGNIAGWPSAAVFRQLGFEMLNLKQPAGTAASYTDTTIYLTGGNANAVIQDLVRQIERAFKSKARYYEYNDNYQISGPDVPGRGTAFADIKQENGVVILYLGHAVG